MTKQATDIKRRRMVRGHLRRNYARFEMQDMGRMARQNGKTIWKTRLWLHMSWNICQPILS